MSGPTPKQVSDQARLAKLGERVKDAVWFLRNGGEDDPYVIKRPENIEGDDDDGTTHIEVADGCAFCSVAANEGQPEIGTAEAIAGAGKLIADLWAEVNRLTTLINTPGIDEFLESVKIEAGHQREKWGEEHDHRKTPGDWSLLLDKIKGKQCQAVWDGDLTKLLHHLITMSAICFNYHRQVCAAIDKAANADGAA